MRADELHTEREALIAEIYEAFRDVTREGGVSWSETFVLDDRGTEAECLAARAKDRDVRWTELVGDSTWEPDTGLGGFSFLDPIGFRYYLPAVMNRSVQLGYDAGVVYHLSIESPPAAKSFAADKDLLRDFDVAAWQLEKLSLLNERQRRCVARFVRFMLEWSRFKDDLFGMQSWQHAWDAYWSKVA